MDALARTIVGSDVLPVRWTDTRGALPGPDGPSSRSVFRSHALEEELDRCVGSSVLRVVATGIGLDSSARAARIAATEPGVWATVGVLPYGLPTLTSDVEGIVGDLELLVLGDDVVAVTCGLGPADDRRRMAAEAELLAAHVELAHRYDLALSVDLEHRAHDALDVIRGNGVPARSLVHGFRGSLDLARQLLDLGFHLSFDDRMRRGASGARDAALLCPEDRLLIESDSHFVLRSPALLPAVGAAVAVVREVEPATVAKLTWRNAREVFRLR